MFPPSEGDERIRAVPNTRLAGGVAAAILSLAGAGCQSAAVRHVTPAEQSVTRNAVENGVTKSTNAAKVARTDQALPPVETVISPLPPVAPTKLAAFRTRNPLLASGPENAADARTNDASEKGAESDENNFSPSTPAPDEAEADEATELPVEQLIFDGMASHPSVRSAQQSVAAAQSRLPQVTALPDPSFNNIFWPLQDHALQTAGGRVGNQMGLNQSVPWPQKLTTQGAIAADEVRVAMAELQATRLNVREQIAVAYVQWWLADELIRIVAETQGWARDLVTLAEAKYRAGGRQQDVLRAELEVDRVAEQLITLRQQRDQAFADLSQWVPLPSMQSVRPADPLPGAAEQATPQIGRLIALAERSNPVLHGLAAEIARDRDRQRLACLQQYPDLQFGVAWTLINDNTRVLSPVANGHDNINFNVGVTLPIWREKINAGIREAAHRRSSTMLRREAERDRLRASLRRQVAEADAAVEQLRLFEDKILPRTERALEITAADYQGNRAGWNDLADLYREWLSIQVQIVRAKASLAASVARLEATVGQPLPIVSRDPVPDPQDSAVPDQQDVDGAPEPGPAADANE